MDFFSKSYLFLYSCISFIVGIGIASYLNENILSYNYCWFGIFCALISVSILFHDLKLIFIPALIGSFLFLGIWRYSLSLPENGPDKIWFYNGQSVSIKGKIIKEPDVRPTNQKLEIEISNLAPQYPLLNRRGEHNVYGKILVTANSYPEFKYGDELELKCELKKPEPFDDFFYDRYLARYEIYSVCYWPKITINGNSGNIILKRILEFKSKLNQIIYRSLPETEAGLASPIILGYKNSLSDFWQNKFSQAGLTHIMAVSGMNISILAAIIMSIAINIGLPRRFAFYFSVLFLFLYLVLIGMQPSALRAGVMGFLVLWAIELGRISSLYNSLALAASILLLFNPRMLRDDVGFQLSFFAVLGLALAMPILSSVIENFSKWKKIIFETLGITVAAQIFTLPIIAINFDQISLIAPISNLLVLWSIYPMMIAIIIALTLSLLIPSFSILFFLPAFILIKYMAIIADWTTRIPFSYIQVNNFWIGWVMIYYALAIWAIIWARKKLNN